MEYRHSLVAYYRLCRFFFAMVSCCGGDGLQWNRIVKRELTDVIPYDTDTLDSLSIYDLFVMNINLLNELADDLCCQLMDIRMLANQFQKLSCVLSVVFLS